MDTNPRTVKEDRDAAILETVARIRSACGSYVFRARNEADLQEQVTTALVTNGIVVRREVIAEAGRYDILVERPYVLRPVTIVLELKIKGGVSEVERQAQKYALTDGVDAVVIVTTSQRLAHGLPDGQLGGKMFRVITLRAF